MKGFFTISILFLCTILSAQVRTDVTYLGKDIDRMALETISRISERVDLNRKDGGETTAGTYYINTEFLPATVVLATNKKYTNVHSRYDALHDVLEIAHEGKVYVLEGSKINTLLVNPSRNDSSNFIHARFVGTENKQGLYQVLAEGKKSLLKRTEVFVKKPDYVPQFNAGSQVTTFSLQSKYYLWNEDKTAIPLKLTRKSVVVALGDHKEELDAFIKTLGGKVSDEATVKLIFDYYNSL
jgi:hypothetical protein